MKQAGLVAVWVAAAAAANLSSTHFGPAASVYNAFFLIGLNLTTRDALHTAWEGRGLRWKMAALIAAGSIVAYAINAAALRIAVASMVAFAVSEVVDAVVYHLARRKPWLVRANVSNVPAAAVDSLVFPTLAFGGFLPWITAGQFVAKVAGGFLWSLLLTRWRGADRGRLVTETSA